MRHKTLPMIKTENFDSELQELAQFGKVFSHPARLMILKYLAEKKVCISGDITDEIPLSRTTVSQHLKELKDAGLIQGELKPPKIKYCINQENWKLAKSLFADFFD